LESDAEHSVQDINSPVNNATPVNKPNKTKEQNFTTPEDLLLCTTWLQISSDPIVHTGQRKEGLWARIEKRYNEQRPEFPCRINREHSSRWDKIRADVSKFSGYYARVLREKQSGLTDDDKVTLSYTIFDIFYFLPLFQCGPNILIELWLLQTSKAATLFAHKENKPFHFMHCWHQLKGEPKWESICQGTSFRGLHAKSIGSSRIPLVGGHESDSGSAGLTGKRPHGRDSSKSEKESCVILINGILKPFARFNSKTNSALHRKGWKERKVHRTRQGTREKEVGIGSKKVKHSWKGIETWRTLIGQTTIADAIVNKWRGSGSSSLDYDEGAEKTLAAVHI
jgi:hypothetical protein